MTVTAVADHTSCVGSLDILERRRRVMVLADMAADLTYADERSQWIWNDLQTGWQLAVDRYVPAVLVHRGESWQRFTDLVEAIREQTRCCGNVTDYADRVGWEGTLDQLEERVLSAVDEALDACFEVRS